MRDAFKPSAERTIRVRIADTGKLQTVLFQLGIKKLPANTETARRFGAIAATLVQRFLQQQFFQARSRCRQIERQ